jgi:hypothetical protein
MGLLTARAQSSKNSSTPEIDRIPVAAPRVPVPADREPSRASARRLALELVKDGADEGGLADILANADSLGVGGPTDRGVAAVAKRMVVAGRAGRRDPSGPPGRMCQGLAAVAVVFSPSR